MKQHVVKRAFLTVAIFGNTARGRQPDNRSTITTSSKILLLLLLATGSLLAQKTNRKLVWEENFDGKALDEKVWNFETGAGGWGNHERLTYDKTSHALKDGNLIIAVSKKGDLYSSTRITTKGKKEFQYGYMEARVKLPTGHGIWPAFWMLGANISELGWPKGGEIDIMEYIGREAHTLYTTIHTQDTHGAHASSKKTEVKDIEDGYHLYACDWNEDRIVFYIDDKPVYVYSPSNKNDNNWPFNRPFFFIINCAVGGDFGGPDVDDKIFPVGYSVDYVRVYR